MILNDNHRSMEDTDTYSAKLEKALAVYGEQVNSKDMPALKEEFSLFTTLFEGFVNILMKKGLIAEDPYKYEEKISEVEPPSRQPVIESEKTSIISQRLSQFERQLDFLNHFFQFNTDYMTLPRIKKLTALVKWVDWNNLTTASTEVNTQILAGIVEKIRMGADPMSTNLVTESAKKMGKVTKHILFLLRKVSIYQREKYKLDIRQNMNIAELQGSKTEKLEKIRASFKQKMNQGTLFIKSLVLEIINEETFPDGEDLKAEVLKKLEVKKEVKKKKEINLKPDILEAVRIFSSAGLSLNDALIKIKNNNVLLGAKELSFKEKFRMWLMNLSGKKKNTVYEVEYLDAATGTKKRMKIDINSFLEEGFREARIISALNNKMSNVYQKLEASPEDKILTFLDTHASAVKKIIDTFEPLNTYLKSEVPRTVRNSVKGVKLEVTAIMNALIKANKKKLEYVARVEELEQMKKLGIDTTVEED